MNTTLNTTTPGVHNIDARDIRLTTGCAYDGIQAVCTAAARAGVDFDRMSALQDIGVLCLYEVIASLHLQIYQANVLIREYAYVIEDQRLEPFGPTTPPLGFVPTGARIRLTVSPNPAVSPEYADDWFRQLGWVPSAPLIYPQGEYRNFAVYTSGGYSISAHLLSNPAFDWPVG